MVLSLDVLALALVPALLWGASPIVSKRGMAGGGSSLQASLVVVLVDTSLYWTALFVLYGSSPLSGLDATTFGVFAFAGLVGTALGRLATFTGVDRVGASVNSAGVSTRPLFATALAAVWLGETVTLTTAAGVLVLVGGLVALALAKGGDVSGWEPSELLFPLAAACAFAVGNVVRKFGLDTTPATTLQAVTINETAALVGLVGYALAKDRRDVLSAPKRTYGLFAISGTLTAVALLSLFEALDRGQVAVVDPLAGTAPLFTTLFAAVFLKDLERVTRGVVAGALLIVVGAAVITAL
ncbi:DMT family transporter [Halorussus halophilus]|uniref:DMT family transporter n=1 Tax=Halorussus halophilus TaxID=2650975 RepID=UPI00130164A2|nr:EamA family transporter [Halorussus halophilus]